MPRRRLTPDYSEAALRDIEDILVYTREHWNPSQAAAYRRSLCNAFRTLAANPQLGRPRDELAAGLRTHTSGSHTIYYRIVNGVVTISRVLHSRQDESRLQWTLE